VHLYTVVTAEAYHVIVTTPDVQVPRTYPITAAALRCKVFALRAALQNPTIDPRPLAQDLYQILLGPVAQDLEGAQAKTLLWVLDDVLRYLPLATLYDGTRYLFERYSTVMITPASASDLAEAPRPTWQGLGLGVSKAYDNFPALTAVLKELRGIIRDAAHDADGVLPGTIKFDDAFTAQAMFDALRQCAPDQCYPVVHIASHFQFHPGNETDSFLLLGDGNHLSLAQLNASPVQVFRGVELLTLSACDTAMGGARATGKEVEGFGTLAQKQGANAVLATLWPIADDSTKDLMQAFYRLRERQPGVTKVEALRQAQLLLLRGQGAPPPGPQVAALGGSPAGETNAALPRGDLEPLQQAEGTCGDVARQPRFVPSPQAPHAHPYYWAPFILIGNWK
jgi:CHAT domain-containing protein